MKDKNTGVIVLLFSFLVFAHNARGQNTGLLDSVYHWSWDTNLNDWTVEDKTLYSYDANGNLASSTRVVHPGTIWVNDWKYEYTYDSANRLTLLLLYNWLSTGYWLDDLEWTYTYDSYGNQINRLQKDWISNSWRNDYQWLYAYDANHNMLSEIQQDWYLNASWLDIVQNQFVYDASSNIASQQTQSWFDSSWVNNNLYLYSYDPNNNQLRRETQNWVVDHWEVASQLLYSYDANDNQLSRLFQTLPGTSWRNVNYYSYTYDVNNNQTSWSRQNWIGGNWEFSFQYYYTYNATNQKITEVRKNFNTDEFFNADSTHYYYSNVIGIAEINRAADGVMIYPNPAKKEFRIQNSEFKIESIEIYDVFGQRVFNSEFYIVNSAYTIDVSGWNSGMYFVKLKTEAGIKSVKFVKQ